LEDLSLWMVGVDYKGFAENLLNSGINRGICGGDSTAFE